MEMSVLVPCLDCEEPLFRKNLFNPNKGLWAMDPGEKMELSREGGETFFLCPRCKGKNHVVSSEIGSLPQLLLSHFTPAD